MESFEMVKKLNIIYMMLLLIPLTSAVLINNPNLPKIETEQLQSTTTGFSGLFTDLDFTGTTGFSDLVDNSSVGGSTAWADITGKPSGFADDTDNDTQYTHLSNFTNDVGFITGYTETEPKWSANYTLYNSTWSSTYNSTYNTWAYNQTTPAINYCDARVTTANLHTHDSLNLTNLAGLNNKILLAGENISTGTIAFARLPILTNTHTHANANLTGSTSSTACSGTDKVTQVTLNNGALSTTCGTDNSAGNSVTVYQNVDVPTTSSTLWNDTKLNFSLETSKTYKLECILLFTGSANTIGQAVNVSSTATASAVNIAYNTWSGATAVVGFSATSFNTALVGTGSGGAVIYSHTIDAYFVTTSSGTLAVKTRAETTGTSTLKAGSVCRLETLA